MKTPLDTRGSRANDGGSARLGKKQPDGTHAHRIAHSGQAKFHWIWTGRRSGRSAAGARATGPHLPGQGPRRWASGRARNGTDVPSGLLGRHRCSIGAAPTGWMGRREGGTARRDLGGMGGGGLLKARWRGRSVAVKRLVSRSEMHSDAEISASRRSP